MKGEQKKGLSLGYFNLARGLGMFLIILGHTMNLYRMEEKTGIFSGMGSVVGGGIMAAFFMISGFGFFRRSFRKCFSIQRKLLLRPYIRVAAAVLVTKLALAVVERRSFWKHGGELVFTYLLGLNAEGGGEILGIPVESVSIFWFVLALFEGWVLYNGITGLKSQRLQVFCVVCCVAAGYVLTLISHVWPYCLPMGLLAVGYLAVGDYMRKRNLLQKKISWEAWTAILAVFLITSAFGRVNIVACEWRLGLLDVAGSFCAGFLILRIYAAFMRREPHGKLTGFLEEVGFHSIWIVCFHAYEKIIFPWYRVAGLFSGYPWLGVGICFLGRCAVMYLIYKLVFWAAGKLKRKKLRGAGL